MTDTAPDPGIYQDVPFADYLAWPAVNNTSLSYAARSLAHYRFAPEQEATDAMRFGSLVHTGKLEPAAIGSRYAVMPDFAADIRKPDGTEYSNVKATKAYKDAVTAWRATVGDKEECTGEQLQTMIGIASALTQHDLAREWLCGLGPVEVALVWDDPDSGVRCKGRVDKWLGGMQRPLLVDLKTTRDASQFEMAVARYAYHRQAAFYSDGLRVLTRATSVQFGVVAVEKELPFGVRAALMSEDALAIGREEYKSLLVRLAECRRTDVWPGYESPEHWTLPAWRMAQLEAEEVGITIRGELVL